MPLSSSSMTLPSMAPCFLMFISRDQALVGGVRAVFHDKKRGPRRLARRHGDAPGPDELHIDGLDEGLQQAKRAFSLAGASRSCAIPR